jgi:hypothetical protein
MSTPVRASDRDLRALAAVVDQDRPDLPDGEGLPPSLLVDLMGQIRCDALGLMGGTVGGRQCGSARPTWRRPHRVARQRSRLGAAVLEASLALPVQQLSRPHWRPAQMFSTGLQTVCQALGRTATRATRSDNHEPPAALQLRQRPSPTELALVRIEGITSHGRPRRCTDRDHDSGMCDHIVRRLIAASRLSSSLPRWARYSCVQVSSWRGSTVRTTFVRSPAGSMSMVVRC